MLLSIAPRIVFVENIVDRQKCIDIISSDIDYINSGTYDQSGNINENSYYRNNLTHRDVVGKFSYLQDLAVNLAKHYSPYHHLDIIPEIVQIQKYTQGQEYKSHCDFFLTFQEPNSTFDKPRIATVIFYLNDDFVDGQTYFDRLDLEVKPVTGSALLFYYPNNNIELSMLTEHRGKPVTSGIKYIATVWLQDNTRKGNINDNVHK
jgi:hypothetical protein